MEFKYKIVLLMEHHGLNQEKLAKELGVSQASVSGWQNGSMPRKPMLKKIADYFELDPIVLEDGTLSLPFDVPEQVSKKLGTKFASGLPELRKLTDMLLLAKQSLPAEAFELLYDTAMAAHSNAMRIQLLEDELSVLKQRLL